MEVNGYNYEECFGCDSQNECQAYRQVKKAIAMAMVFNNNDLVKAYDHLTSVTELMKQFNEPQFAVMGAAAVFVYRSYQAGVAVVIEPEIMEEARQATRLGMAQLPKSMQDELKRRSAGLSSL